MGEGELFQKGKLKGIPVIMVVAVDVALVNLAFYLSSTLRFLGNIPEFNMEPFLKMAPWLSLTAVVLFYALDLYSKQRNGFMPILRAVVTAAAGADSLRCGNHLLVERFCFFTHRIYHCPAFSVSPPFDLAGIALAPGNVDSRPEKIAGDRSL